jgi:urate oxidase
MLGPNRYGKSAIRLFKVHRGDGSDEVSDLTVQVLLTGDFEAAHVRGDNAAVIPTDTMKNTVYAMAQDHLGRETERFALVLASHFGENAAVAEARVTVRERLWAHLPDAGRGFTPAGGDLKLGEARSGVEGEQVGAGIEGLLLLKTTGSGFTGFPRDRFTTLTETSDRLLATSVGARWRYNSEPDDFVAAWTSVRAALAASFAEFSSSSLQQQGYEMGRAVLAALPGIDEIRLRLPNLHHLKVDLTRFGSTDTGVVFQPVDEPHGDIRLTVRRE